VDLVSTLVGVAFGAILSTVLQQFVWNRQQKTLEEREMRKEQARTAERFRDVGTLLIEINRGTVSGSHLDETKITTTKLLENHRLRRELLATVAAVRAAFHLEPVQDERLTLFQRKVTEKSPLDLTEESARGLHSELDALVTDLRADVSISDN
jgi:hypothetical protein